MTRFDDGQMERPSRFGRLHRRGVRVRIARGAGKAVGLAHHPEPAPPRAIARILDDRLAGLADDVGNFRRERTEVGERGRSRRLTTPCPEREDAARGERDRGYDGNPQQSIGTRRRSWGHAFSVPAAAALKGRPYVKF
jgi:hypothetical protein